MLNKDMNRENKPRIVFVLGMHRSGTSCLAGSLERCGLYLGNVNRRSRHNPKGNHELKEVHLIHDNILSSNGGTWYQPPSNIVANPEQKQALQGIYSKLSKHVPCGLKDPRLLLLLNTWMEVVDSWKLIGTFRHPVAVARSLVKRHKGMGVSEEMAYPLWATYNAELVRWHRMYQFPIVEFDLADGEMYCRTIVALAIEFGLYPDMARLNEFVSSDLDHNPFLEESVPDNCKEIYAYLRQHCYKLPIWDDGFERNVLIAQQRYDGWRWSPNRFKQTLHFTARFLPGSFVRLKRKLIRN